MDKNVFTGGRVPSDVMSTFGVVGTGSTKSKTPLPSRAHSPWGGMEVAGAGPLWLSEAHRVPLFPDEQSHHIGSLESTMREFIPWRLANATNWGYPPRELVKYWVGQKIHLVFLYDGSSTA